MSSVVDTFEIINLLKIDWFMKDTVSKDTKLVQNRRQKCQ